MTIQQLQYITALDKYRHFVRAAEACGVTQSTLSAMVRNLENELDVILFDRNSHPVVPTPVGEKIIAQAKVVLYNASQLAEIPSMERNESAGRIRLGIIPTVAPYVLPALFREMRSRSEIAMSVSEMRTSVIVDKLKKAELDMAVLVTPLEEDSLLEIPVYYEKFYAYVSPDDSLYACESIESEKLPGMDMWLLQEGHCFRNQIFNLCSGSVQHSAEYEAGSIDNLVRVVDMNGGHTIIPEVHLPFLSEQQRMNVRNIVPSDSVREVSIVIRNDYVKEGLLNAVSDAMKKIVPDSMLDTRLKKHAIRI